MATAAETVRALTGLSTAELDDAQIDVFLEVNAAYVGSTKLAAADALEVFAGQLATIAAQSDDISIDGSKRASVLMARASRLREQALTEADDAGFTFDVVDSGYCRPELTERPCW
jgi:hypothetical protein